MHMVQAKGILSAKNGMNIYRGCTHGCIYCDARSDCYNMTHAFEDIEVKQNAPQLLEQALRDGFLRRFGGVQGQLGHHVVAHIISPPYFGFEFVLFRAF